MFPTIASHVCIHILTPNVSFHSASHLAFSFANAFCCNNAE
ncbi:MAG: hypothetical protein U9Q66_00880 [Patescibacteria group bacterium]|nr:hypothetical protein [Patescibacteria group bacterium]